MSTKAKRQTIKSSQNTQYQSFQQATAFSQPLISHTSLNSSLDITPQVPILMDNMESQSLYSHSIHHDDTDTSYTDKAHTLPMPEVSKSRSKYFDVDDNFTINTPPPTKSINRKKRKKKKGNKFNFSFAPTLRAPWNENVKDLLLRKIRNRRDTNAIRYIRRDKTAESNVVTQGFLEQRGYKMMYHKLIDRPWLILIFELFLIYTAIYVFFGTLYYYTGLAYNKCDNPSVVELYVNNYWFLCFNFALHAGSTIGFGFLLPKDVHTIASGFTILLLVYSTEIFDTLFIGVLIKKIKKPTRLKTQLRFSEFAVVNNGYSTTREMKPKYRNKYTIDTSMKFQSKYPRNQYTDWEYECGTIHDVGSYKKSVKNDNYKCLMFRFCHIRPRSRMCMPSMRLIYYQYNIVGDTDDGQIKTDKNADWMRHKHQELDFEIYKKRGRMRSDDGDIPMLSLPWTVVHKIDENSPLWGLSKQDLANRKIEIIAIAGGIDEITSDNFQKWWSYTAEEINWNHQFEPMIKCIRKIERSWYYYLFCCMKDMKKKQKEVLEIDFDRLSLISPITRYMYT